MYKKYILIYSLLLLSINNTHGMFFNATYEELYRQTLHYFCKINNFDKVKEAVEIENQDINQIPLKTTPLMEAVKNNNIPMVRYLLKHNADVHIKTDLFGGLKESAFRIATRCGHVEMMQLLVEHGVDVIQEDEINNLLYSLCLGHNRISNLTHTIQDNSSAIAHLLEWNVNPAKQCQVWQTPLHIILKAQVEPSLGLIQLFLDKNVPVDIASNSQVTPLMLACKCSPKIVKFLLSHKANVHAKDWNGQTSLFYGMNNPNIVRLLIDHNANINDTDHNGNTLLHCYCKGPKNLHPFMRDVIPWLYNPRHRIDINAKDNAGNTPLHTIAQYNSHSPELTAILLFYGANYSLKNKRGETAADCVDKECGNGALQHFLHHKPNDDEYPYYLTWHKPYTRDAEKCYSLGEFEKKVLLPYTLPLHEKQKDIKAWRHNKEQEKKEISEQEPLIPRPSNITRRLRAREYGKRMHERLYLTDLK